MFYSAGKARWYLWIESY